MGQPTEGALLVAGMKVSRIISNCFLMLTSQSNVLFFFLQHGIYDIQQKYIRLQEFPFSSEEKIMAVKCVPKYDDVSTCNFMKIFISSPLDIV